MTPRTIEVFNRGLLIEAFQATRNILIWQHVADESEFLKTQDHYIKSLYSFVQQSAQTNFILSLGKLYDKPNKYQTLCITFFLQQMKAEALTASEIVETTITESLLKEYNLPSSIIQAVKENDKSIFPILFSKYYLERYDDINLQRDIESLKLMRDKAVAHNEALDSLQFKLEVADRLLKFVTEIISIFGMAYQSTAWETEKFSFIERDAESDANFVKQNIDNLKKA